MSRNSRVVDPETTSLDALEDNIANDTPMYEMPAKFAGKSAEEIAQAHSNLERHAGQQGNELGNLRRQVDQLLEMQNTKSEPVEPLQVDSLLDNPSKAINSAIDSNPKLVAIERKLAEEDRNKQKAGFEQKHPKWQETMNTEGFKSWIGASSVRQTMWDTADKKYNYALADELFSNYSDIHGARSEQAEQGRQQRKANDLKAAGTVNKGSSFSSTKRYTRAELVNLRVSKPDVYEANKDEIYRAYAENRVT